MNKDLSTIFRAHFGHRDHLYGVMFDHLADDLDAGGPTAEICRDHLDATRADAIQLRLLAGIFRIVLRGDAPELAEFYPSLGGTRARSEAWAVLQPVLATHVDELAAALDKPPQTNEVGRAACLAVGLFDAVRRAGVDRVRLLELGASAGLNLNVDYYRVVGPGWAWGDPASPVVMDTEAVGVVPEEVRIVDRRGCDLDPIDAINPDGAEYLTSFVWPMDVARHARLAGALDVLRSHPVTIDRAAASAWIAEQLAAPVADDLLTVVWSSITQQYWPAAETEAVEETVERARDTMRLARITLEGIPPRLVEGGYDVAEHGVELRVDGRLIARAHHHGLPIVLTPVR